MFRSVIRPTNNSEMGHHHPRLGSPPIAQAFLLERPGIRRSPRPPRGRHAAHHHQRTPCRPPNGRRL